MSEEKGCAQILTVDDNPTNLKVLLQVLEAAGHSVMVATSGQQGLKIAAQARPDLILLDVMMPEMDGYETCQRLKADAATASIPVIFITANDQTEGVVAGFNAGGVDYIPKPFRREEVIARVAAHLDLHRLSRELGEKNDALVSTNRELKETHAKLDEAQRRLIEELEEELQKAHDLQMGLMPDISPLVEGFEVAGRCLPASQVGGDIFQYFVESGNLAISVADVTGHAMEAAIPVVMFSGILKTEMRYGHALEQLFANLTNTLCETLDERTHVCLAMAQVNTQDRLMQFSNSGCPYPFHYRAESKEVIELQIDAYPLGVRCDTKYSTIAVQLHEGDYVVFYSDGIVEADNESGDVVGFDRAAQIIRDGCIADLSAEALVEMLLAEVKTFVGAAPQLDDMTCVVLKVLR